MLRKLDAALHKLSEPSVRAPPVAGSWAVQQDTQNGFCMLCEKNCAPKKRMRRGLKI